MKKTLILLLALPLSLHAQVANPGIIGVTSAPSGACTANLPVKLQTPNGTLFTCQNGTYAAVGATATPTGAAGGDLSGTYPAPTVSAVHATSGTINGVAIGGTTPSTGAFTTVTATGNVNVQGNVSSASNTNPASPTNSGVALNAAPNIADVQMFDATRAANDRTAEWIFWSGAASLRFANDAHNAVATPLTVTGGQASGITGITSNSGTGSWVHTGSFGATGNVSAASFSTTGTVATGAVATGIRTVTSATYAATATDHTIICSATANPINVTLPSSPPTGMVIAFKKADSTTANACTLGGGGFQIDGGTSIVITAQYSSVVVQFDGTKWWIISSFGTITTS